MSLGTIWPGARAAGRLNVGAVGIVLALLALAAPRLHGPDAPVADAAADRDLARVEALIRDGADVDAAQGDGMTALHWAARYGSVPLTELLLSADAALEPTTRLGAYTPLHMAAELAHAPVVTLLLDAGADASAMTSTGVTPIHFAAVAGSVEAIEALVAHGADIDARDRVAERTPLMFATARNRVDAVAALLDLGADVTLQTRVVDFVARSEYDGEERRERDERVKAEREAREKELGIWKEPEAEEDEAELVVDPDDPDIQVSTTVAEDGEAPPEEATEDEEDDAPEEDEEADEEQEEPLGYDDLVGNQGGMTALHLAVRDGHAEEVRLLLDAGADLDGRTGGDQSTPLVVALINGNYDLALELLEAGADPNLASEDGVAPLYATLNNRWAPKALYPQPTAFKQQSADYLDVMEALLRAGADPNARVQTHIWYTSYNFDLLGVNFRGATPFWRAAYATDVPAMRLLVEWGADPGIPTQKAPERRRRGSSDDDDEEDPSGLPPVPVGGPAVYPIHAASGVGYGVARAGNSHRHAHEGWLPAVRYLVEELGADVNQRDLDGFSAVHHAAARGDNELIEYLVSQGADVTFVSRRGQTTVDMANGPQQRVQPFPETIALLESLGAKNNHNCMSC
ncbi:MAG TPA: ankyrin repeat domain-containing protein [Longimicrobiales bacterium]|nr:ankyrin repeat domain-containing protein [Longimicrobiales bacterium]